MRKIVLCAALGLLIAGCATPRPFLAPILKEAGPKSLGHYVGSRRDKGAPMIETGSGALGETLFDPATAVNCRQGRAYARAKVTLCSRQPLNEPMLDWWLADFGAALDSLSHRVFDETPTVVLDITLYVAGPADKIDFVRRTPFDGRTAALAFVTRAALLREPMRRVPSQTFAHEAYHAIIRAKRLLNGEAPRKAALTEIILEESAAEFFGLCASLQATNVAVRAEANHEYRGRPGGVLQDAELRSFLAGDFEKRKPPLSRYEVNVIAEMVATTLWSDTIGPTYIAEGASSEGRAIFTLCTKENLATQEAFRTLLLRHAEDGKDADPLPPFEGEIRSAYFQAYRDAVARRRADYAVRDQALKAQAPM